MKVILAGYNLDHETVSAFKAAHPDLENLTPETISTKSGDILN